MAIRSLKTGSFSRSTQVGNSIILPGDYESIATTTLSTSASSITFSNIPQTFTHLQLRLFAQDNGGTSSAARTAVIQFNSDTGNNYTVHSLQGDGASATSSGSSSGQGFIQVAYIPESGYSNTFGVGIIDLLDYTNTNKYKTLRSLNGNDVNGAGYAVLFSGMWMNTNAISTITLKLRASLTGSYSANTHAALYGIRG